MYINFEFTASSPTSSMKKQGCDIEALGINYTVYKHKNPKHVLKDVNVRAKPYELLAIVGLSGAGKSSLLQILASEIAPQSGTIYVNCKPLDKSHFKKLSGYVKQKDTLFPLLTVEETLRFSAKFRLSLSDKELSLKVKSLMKELGLSHVASTRVGDEKVRGISGGERRRVSIGVEAIHEPQILILDEPTSGLDSTSALQIIDMLKTMAETRGLTVILSIHQPGFRIVKLFNSVLLLANGSVLHHGSVNLLAVNLRLMGLEIPLHVDIVEFAIESIDTLKQHRKETVVVEEGKFTLKELFQRSKVMDDEESLSVDVVGSESFHDFANLRIVEIGILTCRFWKNIYRTKELFTCRTISMLISGLALGSIFYKLKDDLDGAMERVGLFAFVLTFLLSSTTEALPIFLQEREILMKEISSGSYRISSYVIANGVVYLPFLLILAILFSVPLYWLVGLNRSFMAFVHFLVLIWLILYTANSVVVCFSTLVPNFIVGNSVISAVMGAFFLFSGYFISKNEIPKYWIFMNYVSLFKYPFESLLVNEFANSKKCLDYFVFGECKRTEEDVLREEGYGDDKSVWKNYVIMICIILVYRFISYIILRCRCSEFGIQIKGS